MKKPVKPLERVKPLQRTAPLKREGNIIDRKTEQARKNKKTPMAPKKYAQGGMVKKGKC